MVISGNSSEAYLEWRFRLVSSMFWVPLTVIGICGNLMVILVVMTVRGMKTPTNCYLVSLAVADCLFFLSTTPVELSSLHLPEDIFLFGRIGCSIFRFLPFLSMNISSLSISAFTVERYIGICHPMKARYICTVKRAQLITVIIWSCSILYNSTWLFLTDLKPLNYTDWPNAYQCTYSLNRASYKAVFLLDLVAFYWIPLLLYLILYGSMARILIKAGFFHGSSFKSADADAVTKPSSSGSNYSVQTALGASTNRELSGSPGQLKTIKRGPMPSLRKSQSNVSTMAMARNRLRSEAKVSTVSFGGSQIVNGTSSLLSPPCRNDALLSVNGYNMNGGNAFSRVRSSISAMSESDIMAPNHNLNNFNIRLISANRSYTSQDKSAPPKDSKAYGEGLNKARVQVVKMLVVIVLVFALFWLPYRGLVVYNSFTKKPWIEKWYLLFAKTMVMVNCAINPILYNVMSGKFRLAFRIMFRRCCGGNLLGTRYYGEAGSLAALHSQSVIGSTATLNQIGRPKRSTSASPYLAHNNKHTSNTNIVIPGCELTVLYSPVQRLISRRKEPILSSIAQSGACDSEEIADEPAAFS